MQRYDDYLAAREVRWRAQHPNTPQNLLNQYAEYERAMWNAFMLAQNQAKAEPNVTWVNPYAAQLDTAIENWSNLIRTLYIRRDLNAYATDPSYRAGFDKWVQNWTAYGNAVLAQLSAYRQQFVGTPSPPVPPMFDPRYVGSDNGPIVEGYHPSRAGPSR